MSNLSAPPPGHEDHPDITSHNSRLGLVLFFVYLALYAGFIAVTTFRPNLLAKTPFAGVNLAILYGFGLILAALILAAVYMALCKPGSSGQEK